jgi:hypothetical protein
MPIAPTISTRDKHHLKTRRDRRENEQTRSVLQSINPFSGEVLKTYAEMSADEVHEAIGSAHERFASWKRTSFSERGGFLRREKSGNTIEVNLEELQQFFNTIDPSPFHEKDLDHDLEEFIVSWATEYPLQEKLRLVIYLQNPPAGTDAQSVIEKAVHNYFAYKTDLNHRELKLLFREGRISLLIGIIFLTVCLSGGQIANRLQIPGANIVEASLTIAGWVAMWRPMEVFLYGWWPLRRAGKVYRKLSSVPVEVRYSTVANAAGKFAVHASA